ncbi:MAG: polymer-forming cytoskeletal protein [Chloroflexi bacterium]|nr:polymer-forming cytoskeletal protein [Chloroflexota bacterium]
MNRRTIWVALTLLILLLSTTTATAAERISQTIYRIPAGETIADDLYITASEVYINGTIDGDLIVTASYVEINGTVTGDVLLAALGAKISGEIQDTARMAVGGLEITGRIGGDLAILTSGGATFAVPLNIAEQQVIQGLTLHPEGEIAGSLLLSAGTAVLNGRIGRDILGTATVLTLAGPVGGDTAVETTLLTIEPTAAVAGLLAYTAPQAVDVAETTAANTQFTPALAEDAGFALAESLVQLIGTLTGFALLGWLILHYAPILIYRPIFTISSFTLRSAWVGFMVGLLFLGFPIATLLISFSVGVFWGTTAALILGLFIICALVLIWIFSPLFIALWLGLFFNNKQPLSALLIGLVILIPLLQFPLIGSLLSLLCFCLVLGSLVLYTLPKPAAEG